MTFVHYNGSIAAIVGASGFHLAPHLEDRAAGDPECCFVVFMAAHAMDVQSGAVPGPYSDERAALFARFALIDDAEFAALSTGAEVDLAIHFNVPASEIAVKRADLAPRWASGGPA